MLTVLEIFHCLSNPSDLVDGGNLETVVLYASALLILYGKCGVRNGSIKVHKNKKKMINLPFCNSIALIILNYKK